MSYRIESVPAGDTRPLRHQVLRPDQPLSACVYPLDNQRSSGHFVARDQSGALVGVASVFREDKDGATSGDVWRLRGMATADSHRGLGLGRRLLEACIEHVRAQCGSELWCNGRSTAAEFYQHHGFSVEGDEFDLPGLGPHYVLSLGL